jgi:hypothetical protein
MLRFAVRSNAGALSVPVSIRCSRSQHDNGFGRERILRFAGRSNTGATPDGVTVAPSLARHRSAELTPKPGAVRLCSTERLVYDRAAGTPKHIADVRRASDGQTQLVARQINYGQRHTRFAPSDFTLGPDRSHLSQRRRHDARLSRRRRRWLQLPLHSPVSARVVPSGSNAATPKRSPTSHRARSSSPTTPCSTRTGDSPISARRLPRTDFSFRANIERHIAGLTQHNGARHAKSIWPAQSQLPTQHGRHRLQPQALARPDARTGASQGHKERPPCPDQHSIHRPD